MTARVAASLPSRCTVCAGHRRLRLVSLVDLRGAGVASCVHCSPEPGLHPIPIYDYPFRTDHPRAT